jgi:acetyltransferase-like isoleucine patch superfamily enzyme
MEDWKTETGLSREEFEKFTIYCNRSDNLVDNRNRARILGITAEGCMVLPGCEVRLGPNGRIGKNVLLGLYSYINGNVVIGDNVLVGPHCSITSNNHVFNAAKGWFGDNKGEPVEIGEGSWLASAVMVTAGVKVGKYNLLCAHAVVTKNTPDYAIMAGVPARQVGEINPQTGQYTWYNHNPRHIAPGLPGVTPRSPKASDPTTD